MKIKSIVSLLSVLALAVSTFAHGSHSHEKEKRIETPNRGRLIAAVEPHLEFLVLPDRKVQITFIDDDGKAVAPAAQVVTVTAGSRLSPTRLTFAKSGNVLLSNAALPSGNGFPTVVQIKESPSSKTVVERFNLDLTKCAECERGEYACICDHGDDHGHKH